MAFSNSFTNEIPQIGPGEQFDPYADTVLSSTTFEDGLQAGRFAKLDAGSIDNMDGSVTPVIAGVVLRDVSNAVQNGGQFSTDLYTAIAYLRSGLVSVAVAPGETAPAQFTAITASNAGDAEDGKAVVAGGEATTAEFIKELIAPGVSTDGVWLVKLA